MLVGSPGIIRRLTCHRFFDPFALSIREDAELIRWMSQPEAVSDTQDRIARTSQVTCQTVNSTSTYWIKLTLPTYYRVAAIRAAIALPLAGAEMNRRSTATLAARWGAGLQRRIIAAQVPSSIPK